ncbi:hypothetical protein [Gemmatimonas sp.]|uniref:hypothetical protein n=1 Tax=Gemmatimonas sp. TaxID=1962908 RepID=UPI003567219C
MLAIRWGNWLLLPAVGLDDGEKTPQQASPSYGVGMADRLRGPGETMPPARGGRIWYKQSGVGTGTPVVLMHGGPGAGSFYLKPFEALGDDRLVVRYDQLGAGKSNRLADTTLMNIPRFVEELDSLRRTLEIDR